MLLGIVSDVHCNAQALKVALAEMESTVDEILLAGDAVLQYRFSNDVLEAIQENDISYVVGNHELTLLQHGTRATSAPEVRRHNLEYMANAPKSIERRVSHKSLLMVHASPFAPYSDYLHAGSPHLARCGELDVDFLILGHTHVPMAHRVGRTLVVNAGSLGQGGEPGHQGMVSYAILDTDSDEVVVRRFENPAFAALAG